MRTASIRNLLKENLLDIRENIKISMERIQISFGEVSDRKLYSLFEEYMKNVNLDSKILIVSNN